MEPLVIVLLIAAILATAVGVVAGVYFGMRRGRARLLAEQEEAGANRRKMAEEEAARIISEADKRGKQLEIRARDEALRLTSEAEEVIKKRRVEIDKESERLDRRREELDKRYERMDLREREMNKRQSRLDKQKQEFDKLFEERKAELERVAQMTRDEARGELLAAVEIEARGDMARKMREIDEEAKAEAERRARAELDRRRSTRKPDSGSTVRTGPPPAPHPRAGVAVATAKAQLGKPYLWAADGPDSFDCSGLTMYSWAAAGVSMPHSSGAQYSRFPHVSIDELVPGDLLFYGSPIHHVGMFVGGGQMVNAPQTGETVRISSIYRDDFVGATRPG